MGYKQLIINPGSTSTKLALYDGTEKVVQENLEHAAAQLHQIESIAEQVPFRLQIIRDFMARTSIRDTELSAVMGRGGLVFGLKTGGYEVNDDLCQALVSDKLSQAPASTLGGLLASEVARPLGIPAYIYDAVTGGELSDVAKSTGIPDFERRSFCHVLNSHAMASRYAQENGLDYNKSILFVAHLGGGISASVHAHGQIIDSVGDYDGQFSPERSGCAGCGAPAPERADVRGGILCCTACSAGEGLRLPLSGGALAAMRYIVSCDPNRGFSFRLEGRAVKELCDIAETNLQTQLERGFYSLDFFISLLIV